MSDINTDIVDSAISTVDNTTSNDTTSQPSGEEQLKAEIAKWKAIAERKSKQLESVSKATQETEVNAPVQNAVRPTAGQETKGNDDRIEAIEFKMLHPELDIEDMQVVMKIAKMEGVPLADALNNPLVKNNLEYKKQQQIINNATLSQTRGTTGNAQVDELSRINALSENDRKRAILDLLQNAR